MLHNSGGFGPGGNPSNANLSEKTPKMSAPSNVGHNMGNLSDIAQQQLRTTSERYDVPIHGSYNYELSSYNANLGTFSAYQNRRLPDVFDPNSARYHDLNWPSSLATHMQSVPFQNMPHYMPPFDAARVNTDQRNQSAPNSHVPDHRTMEHYHMYNRNKDNFSHYNQSFEPAQQAFKMDISKQKKLENTVKLLENIITNSSNPVSTPPNANYNDKPINLGKCDDEDKILLKDLLGDHEIENTHFKQSIEMEKRDKEIEKINSKHKYPHIPEEMEPLHTTKELNLSKELTEYEKHVTDNKNDPTFKETLQVPESPLQCEQNTPSDPETDDQVIENDENPPNDKEKTVAKDLPMANNEETVTKDLPLANNEETLTKDLPNQSDEHEEDSTNENEEEPPAVSAEAELEIKEDKDIKVEINTTEDVKDSTTQEEDFAKIFLRDTNKMSFKDVKKRNIVDCVTSVEKATASIKKGKSLPKNNFYECEYCNFYFQHPKRFLIHVKWHTFGIANEKRKEMTRQQELEKQQSKSAKTQHCDMCEKKFKTLSSLTNHKQRFHSSEQLECPDCGVAVSGVLDLRAHRRAEHPQPWVCGTCRRQCSNKYTLAKHMRTHLEKHISCPHCEKLFATETQLKDHFRVHERIARGAIYKCSFCDKSFYQTYNLQAHEKTHSNERPYECGICSTKFSTNSSLKRHLRVSHNTEKPYACSECNRCFAEKRTLVGHMSKAHPGSGPLGAKAAKKVGTKTRNRKGKKGKKSKKADDSSDTHDSDMNAEYM